MSGCCGDAATQPHESSSQTHHRVGFVRRESAVALAGNPNSGKSTIFNALTGAHQHTGNWPGKTVEKKEGRLALGEGEVALVDLPGTYSLSAYSNEEIIAMDYLLDCQPDGVVAVVDAGNLERNLYLTVQIVEMGLPVIVALNMMDSARGRGLRVNLEKLSRGLGGAAIVPTVARSGQGLDALKVEIARALGRGESTEDTEGTEGERQGFLSAGRSGIGPSITVDYGPEIEAEIGGLAQLIASGGGMAAPPRWVAIKLLEGDPHLAARIAALPGGAPLLQAAQTSRKRVADALGDESDILIADRRYGAINALVREAVERPAFERHTSSDRIDRVITHPILGLPIFALIMWLVFQMTVNVSAAYVDWIDGVFGGPLSRWVAALLGLAGLGGTWLESLLLDGVIAGVGGVLVFIPVLVFMYLFIAVLEDSGYLARAAFLMDRFMHLVGLHGKSFIPMLLGFGCSVPGIYATRTLEDEKDRLLTGLLVPFMSCGARLPVYMIIGVAFFGARAGTLIFALYVLGIVMALAAGLLLRRTLFRAKEEAPFMIELPPYRLPTLRGVLRHTWERTKAFIQHAGTVILLATVVVWLLLAIPVGAPVGEGASFAAVDAEHSALATVSRLIAPLFGPAGFANWQSASALVTGFVAKEVIVSTLSIVYVGAEAEEATGESASFWQDLGEIGLSFALATWDALRATASLLPGINLMDEDADAVGSAALIAALRGAFSPLAAVAFSVFVLLTAPCVATLAVMRQEFGLRWTAFSVGLMLALAWVAAVVVYQGGRFIGLG